MESVNQHEFESDDAERCKHCGTNRAGISIGQSCIWRHVERKRSFASAMDDTDAIYARIRELREEQDKAIAGA